ncbi:hypothetical protein [Candidatus Poriferisodalis sp.]|uniref:hypothetical protein n=1 Tax=Candidatus Poriferisodalis sp. TaxID=3101277 RepID=UPI003B592544
MVETEEKLGRVVLWDSISADGTQAEVDFLKMKPEVKIRMARQMFEKMAPAEAHGVLQREWSEADADTFLGVVAPRPVPMSWSDPEEGDLAD